MKVELHNEENKDNKRWLVVTNSIEGDTHHRDFVYYRYKINMLWHKLVFNLFWKGYNPEALFIQTYDMQNLKKWETGKLTKDLIDSGYFDSIKRMGRPSPRS